MKNLICIDLHCRFVLEYFYSFVLTLRFSVALLQYVIMTCLYQVALLAWQRQEF